MHNVSAFILLVFLSADATAYMSSYALGYKCKIKYFKKNIFQLSFLVHLHLLQNSL